MADTRWPRSDYRFRALGVHPDDAVAPTGDTRWPRGYTELRTLGEVSTLPTSVVNDMALWLRADLIRPGDLNGTTVPRWRDPIGDATQSTEAAQPEYDTSAIGGRAGVVFDGSDDVLVVPAAASINNIFAGGGYYAAAVQADGAGGGNAGRFFDKSHTRVEIDSSRRIVLVRNFSGGQAVWRTLSAALTFGTPAIAEVSYNEGSTANVPTIRVNGASLTIEEVAAPSGSASSDAGSDLGIGGNPSLARSWDGPQAEHIFVGAIPSAAEQAAVRTYLSALYGIALS